MSLVTAEAINYNRTNFRWWYSEKYISAEQFVQMVDWFTFTSNVVRFQSLNELTPDGKLGPKTLARMQAVKDGKVTKIEEVPRIDLWLDSKSLANLSTCHDDLQKVFHLVARNSEITITCGHRTKEDQDAAVARGTTSVRWPKSRHNSIPSEAVDVAPRGREAGAAADVPYFIALAPRVKQIATDLGIKLDWGGDWTGRMSGDYYHWELKK